VLRDVRVPGKAGAVAVLAKRDGGEAPIGWRMFKRRVGELVKRPGFVALDATAVAAATAMAAADVSCLAVVTGRRVVGFVTERELCRRLDVDVEAATPVGEILTRAMPGVPKTMLVEEAIKVMLDRQTRHLVVLGPDGCLGGLVTDKELVDALAVDFMVENIACQELLRATPPAVSPDLSIRHTLAFMREKDLDAVLAVVLDKPVGIFTDRDATGKILGYPERLTEPLAHYMTAPVASVPTTAMVYKVILFMRQRGVRRVALFAADGSLAGLLSQQHILSYARCLG